VPIHVHLEHIFAGLSGQVRWCIVEWHPRRPELHCLVVDLGNFISRRNSSTRRGGRYVKFLESFEIEGPMF
jgi:hypothetical protein